jgi:nicotinate-nucleotide adenylyltransferase
MRIAFFGGTFDPPHRGHLAIAGAAADRLRLDRVLFAPVGHQPLKQNVSSASFADRVAMVRLAIAHDARFALSMVDAPRSDGGPNYTIDTVGLLKASLQPEDQLFCLVGADSFLSLPRWHRAGELLVACDFIVAGRPGFELQNVEELLPPAVRLSGEPQHAPGLVTFCLTNEAGRSSALYFLPDLKETTSATEVRSALAEGRIDDGAVPEPVAEYIRAHHLYK